MQTLQICDFVHDYYTCALCVYTNAVCPVIHMTLSCPCVCRKCAGLCATVLHGPCHLFLVPSEYSLILFYFTDIHCLFHCSAALFPPVLSPLSFLCCSPPLLCPPHLPLPPPPFTTQLLTGCIYHHPKEAQQPQSPGTAAAERVVHKQAFRTTAK